MIFEAACEAGSLSCSSGNMCTFTTLSDHVWLLLMSSSFLSSSFSSSPQACTAHGRVYCDVAGTSGSDCMGTARCDCHSSSHLPTEVVSSCVLSGWQHCHWAGQDGCQNRGTLSLWSKSVLSNDYSSHSLYTVRMQVLNFVLHTRMCAHYVHDLLLHTGSNVRQCMWLLLWCMLCYRIEAQWRFWVDRWHVL